ncbi:MAG: tRNA (N(6)-L-threonylcarbamoyladenosine(37)-C(2))-methylthiotransferase MtaB [Candidatus Thermofonsia Clade 1 bacterium]|uniref:tRNA (N(6)-L-threonylcarbamoyladenosine(37)-C(2))-methylthiotransferase MtaB n=1 Tax=Candidatus Thermofonsia Clade 1 bacterium TaxID=2364210 RepID=A0A2M8P1I3_9CHLR|nr:MAG: tRNA (N(6)-L-threonylcarbamoyladenosine(37)-C(2))-methylthiotransferase MtaB [Candidatus Thermofonsia Clade 1 bacterium]
MKVHLKTLGCRLNQSEMDSLARQFVASGNALTDSPAEADLIVVNTCAVTQEAVRSSRQSIHRLHRANPQAQIAVTGCYAHLAPESVRQMAGVAYVVDNHAKESLVSIVTGAPLASLQPFDLEPIARQALIGAGGRTRAFLKVQDGCDRHCTFCITRIARGKGRSRPIADVVAEAQMLVAHGYRELVLTGVHLGSYGHDLGQPDGLVHLLCALLSDTDAPRIRLSSLEPWDLPRDLFTLWEDRRLCRHLHLPLQSGCDATLKRMVRRTTQASFRALVAQVREIMPDAAIATDVIVGFPGETDEEFAISRAFIEEMDFAALHVFRYSLREGTAAARMPNHVPEPVKRERADTLIALGAQGARRFAERFIGQRRPVLWEAVSGATERGFINNGYTDNFLRVRCITPHVLSNALTDVRLIGFDDDETLIAALEAAELAQIGAPAP